MALLISPAGKFYKIPDEKLEDTLKPFEMKPQEVQEIIAEVQRAKAEKGEGKETEDEVAGYLRIPIDDMMPMPGVPPFGKPFPRPMPTFRKWRIMAI